MVPSGGRNDSVKRQHEPQQQPLSDDRPITGRWFRHVERDRLTNLANMFGRAMGHRNLDLYSTIGMEGWWDANRGMHKGLHLMNPLRGGFIVGLLSRHGYLPDHRILDMGCGGGILTEYLAREGFSVTGIDQSAGALAVARRHAAMMGLPVNYLQGDVYNLGFADECFDAVVSCDFLEHIRDLDRALAGMCRVLKPGGLFVFDTIARNENTVREMMAREVEGTVIQPGTHDPVLFVNPEELQSLCDQYGVELARDYKNPFGLWIRNIVKLGYSYHMEEISAPDRLLSYIGYGIKRAPDGLDDED